MSKIEIECKGLPCPQPVLKCKEAIEKDTPERISILVDNEAAKINVSRFLGSQGYDATVDKKGTDFLITGSKADNTSITDCEIMDESSIATVGKEKHLIFIPSEVIGSGDDDLGGRLMYNFLLTLKEMGSDLWRIVLVNGGVKLSTPESPCMVELKKLEESGVSILVCGTCLEHFGLSEAKEVGEVTNMLDIITSFQLATKTIRV